jgi:Family of unknown function (DUF6445)
MFTAQPQIQVVTLTNGQQAYVIDNFCTKPELWLQLAQDNRALFRDAGALDKIGYPGIELIVPEQINQALVEFFMLHIRRLTETRREIYSVSRLSMVTLRPAQLSPAQCICHRDIARQSGGRMTASVLYLSDNPAQGGTSFYRPTQSLEVTAQLVQDSLSLTAAAFTQRYGLAQNYMLESNQWFEKIGSVKAKYNRIVFYSGDIYHSADIAQPQWLSDDPATGRLTLNGFFYFSATAASQ